MLANLFREDRFAAILGAVSRQYAGRRLSTDEFFRAVERKSGQDLRWFVLQYVHGTGIPEVYYTYESAQKGDGRWTVTGKLRLMAPHRFRPRVVPRAEGRWDVVNEGVEQARVEDWDIVVPFQVMIHRKDQPEEETGEARKAAGRKGRRNGKEEDDPRRANAQLNGRLLIRDFGTPFSIDLEYEPLGFWLDRRREVLAHFFAESRYPQRMLRYQAETLVAGRRLQEAEETYLRALKAPFYGAEAARDEEELDTKAERATIRLEEAVIRLGLARIHLDRDLPNKARLEIAATRDLMTSSQASIYRDDFAVLESRLHLADGEPEKAFSTLKSGIRYRWLNSVEGRTLFAVAALLTDHMKDYERELAVARRRGADVSALEARAP